MSNSATVQSGYTITHPHNPYEGAVSFSINDFGDGETPWQAQVYVEGELIEADYFATEAEALRWAAREVTLIACVAKAADPVRDAAPAMLEALEKLWAFASTMAERHGMNGDDTMTDEDHAAWQDAGGAANAAHRAARGEG
jgi:hypothetical protein